MLGFLGPEGTFSQQAAIEYSKGCEELKEYPTIMSCIKAVDMGDIEHCIVPIENSLNGSVTTTLDTLAFESNVFITAEFVLKITQNVVVKKGAKREEIKVIMSHPQALGQCSKLLENEFLNVELKAVSSTAAAAKIVAESDGSIAAITPKAAAELYNLDVLYPECNDGFNNFTRFVIIGKNKNMQVGKRDKSSVVFSTEHVPGSLYKAIGILGDEKINMLKIESRPLKNEFGKYVFFIDIEGNADDARIYFALDKIRKNSFFYKFLGSYPFD